MRFAQTFALVLLFACTRVPVETAPDAAAPRATSSPRASVDAPSGELKLPPGVIAEPHVDASGLVFGSLRDAAGAVAPSGEIEILHAPSEDARLRGDLRTCYEKGLRSDPAQSGVVTWTSAWSEAAWRTNRTSKSVLSPETEACMAEAVRAYASRRPTKDAFEVSIRCVTR